MSAHKAFAAAAVPNLPVIHHVAFGQVGVGLEGVASPLGVVPVVAFPTYGSVACIEGECCPVAVLARGVVGYAVGDVLLAVAGCCVGEENIAALNGGDFNACGILAGVPGVGIFVARINDRRIVATCFVARNQ